MRTTLVIDDDLMAATKVRAAQLHRTLSAFVGDAVREKLLRGEETPSKEVVSLKTFKGKGLRPGVNLNSHAELMDLMEDR
jgi:plasmid stability protein